MQKKVILLLGLFCPLILILVMVYRQNVITEFQRKSEFRDYNVIKSRLGSNTYFLYIADDETKRNRGLSYTSSLNSDEGMLFIFDKSDRHGFWMKDMNYPLDLIFLNNHKIVDIIQNINPDSFPTVFKPQEEANQVIELNSGQVVKAKLKLGDTIDIN